MEKIKKSKFIILIIIFTITIFVVGFYLFMNKPEPAAASWWNDNWSYRKAIVINSDYVTGDLVDFPVLISLTDTNLGARAQADGDDIIFIDSEGKKLAHEIESFATSTGVLVAWVKIPSLSSTEDTVLNMYYGNAGAGNQQDAENVWDENYKVVQHMNEDGGTIYDSTINNNDGAYNGNASTTAGKHGNGSIYDGVSDYASFNSMDFGNLFTISMWVNPETKSNIHSLLVNSNGGNTTDGFRLSINTAATSNKRIRLETGNGSSSDFGATPLQTADFDIWNYIVVVVNRTAGQVTFYHNGNEVTSNSTIRTDFMVSSDWRLGALENDTSNVFELDGKLDEVRVSTASRTLDWIKTSYTNQASTTLFLSVQAEETGPGPIGYWSFDEGYGATANDESGQGNDGTITGATWQDESMCVSGKCLYFDGNGQNVNAGDINQIDEASELSICLWIKIIKYEAWDTIVYKGSSDDYRLGMQMGAVNGRIHALLANGNNSGAYADNVFTENEWVNMCMVFNGSGGNDSEKLKMYIDGTEKTLSYIGTLPSTTSTSTSSFIAGTDYLNGFIDEVKIYPYARTPDEIKQDYAAGVAGISSNSGVSAAFGSQSESWMSDGLVGYWAMDESATTSGAIDASGNGNDGTYYGNASTTAGKFGNGGVFDGSGDYITLTSDIVGLNTVTVCSWFNPKTLNGDVRTIIGNYKFYFGPDSINSRLWLTSDTSGSVYIETPNNSLSQNTWTHACAVRISNGMGYIYLNGELSVSGDTNTPVTDSDLTIGGHGGSSYSFDGQIDEVRIYNRALSPREVKKLYEWAPGPVAWWKFDELTGDTAYDSVASTTAMGGNHGTLGSSAGADSADPAWSNRGKYGSALDFDGTDDYVDAGADSKLKQTGGFSVSAWVYPEANALNNTRIVASTYEWVSASEKYGWRLGGIWTSAANKNKMVFNIFNGTGASKTVQDDNFFTSLNAWQHVTAVYKPSEYIKIYVNGAQISENTSSIFSNVAYQAADKFGIGKSLNVSAESFDGLIDDVRVYNYARTQKQILEDMNGGRPALKSPVLDLSFDKGYGGTAYDSSIHRNDGTLYPGIGGANTATSAMWSLDGKLGKAMEFDGTDDYVDIGDVLDFGANDGTITAWIKTSGHAGYSVIASKIGYLGSAYQSGWGVGLRSSGRVVGIINENGTGYITSTDDGLTVDDGAWHHVAVIMDRDGNMTRYVDREQTGSQDDISALNTVHGSTNKTLIGAKDQAVERWWFDGLIDEVKVYPYALTQEDINLDYNQGMAAVMGAGSTATTSAGAHVPSNAASRKYCVPGSDDYCAPPVLELKFDELTGTTTYDTSGNGNDGYFVNAASSPQWWDIGKYGSALKFDGVDDYVRVEDSDTLSFVSGTTDQPLSINMWIKYVTVGDLLMKWRGGDREYIYYINSNGLNLYLEDDSANAYIGQYQGSNTFIAGEWYNLVATYDGGESASGINLYINGQLLSSSDDSFGVYDSMENLNSWLGFGDYQQENYFNGLIDHIKIYDYARTPAQIAWDYNKGKPIAHWDFNECSGSTIYDQSRGCKDGAGCNNGTLNLGASGVTATGTCASSSNSFWYNGKDGKRNSGGSFDGGDDYVVIGDNDIFDLVDEYTLSAWVKLESDPSSYYNVLSKTKDVVYDATLYMQIIPDQKFVVGFGASSGWRETQSQNSISLGEWHHLLGIFDNSANKIDLYLDGIFEATKSNTFTPNLNTGSLDIGAYQGVGGYGGEFDGKIDDVKIFNYALTPEQVKTEYNGGAVRFGQ